MQNGHKIAMFTVSVIRSTLNK